MRFLLTIAALAVPAGTIAGQAVITGRILNDSSKAPLAGVEIIFEHSGPHTTSDSAGKFTLTGVPAGVGYATVRKIGFRPARLKALIFGADSIDLEVRLRPSAVELPPIEVTAAAVPRGLERFAERRLSGLGRFVDSKVLRAAENRRLSDVLRERGGVQTVLVGGTKEIAISKRAGRPCPMAVWLDGLRIYAPGGRYGSPVDLNDYPIDQIEAVEIYAGEAETPSELGGQGTSCGTLVLWTRRP